jgi:pyruvate carboxylase
MTMFLITRGIKPADVVNLEPGSVPFPESVIDMLAAASASRWAAGRKKNRGGTHGKAQARSDDRRCFQPCHVSRGVRRLREDGTRLRRPVRTADAGVFLRHEVGQEVSVEIEPGKTLFIRLVNIGAVDPEGKRAVNFELNGMARQLSIVDKSAKPTVKARVKADPAKPAEVGAPIPGLVTALAVSVGAKVAKGDKLLTLEAMKMQTTIYASADGVVEEICVQNGDAVESKDLILKIRPA